jgi:D-glycero-D-manno-heptose 1,7-bisphosphate phosphatase
MTIDASAAASPVPESRRAAFVDRDGVINRELGHVHRDEDFELLPGAVDGLRRLQAAGYALVVVTNQAGIAKGLYDEERFNALSRHMTALLAREGVRLDGIYYCPHHPRGTVDSYRLDCDCRKPRPGMLLRAAAELNLALSDSVLIGDKRSDIDAGRAAGVGRCVLVRSGHEASTEDEATADACLTDLAAAALWLTGQPLG